MYQLGSSKKYKLAPLHYLMFYDVNVKNVKLQNLALSFGVTVLNIVFYLSCFSRICFSYLCNQGVTICLLFYLGQSVW